MATATINEALLLLSKVSTDTNKRLSILEKTVGKTVGSTKVTSSNNEKKRESVFDKGSSPVMVTDFSKKAEKDLKTAFTSEDGEGGDMKKPPSFLQKIIGPALLVLGGIAALVTGLMSDGPLKGFLKILSKGGLIGGVKLFAANFGKSLKGFGSQFAKILPKNLFKNVVSSAKGFLGSIGKFLLAPFKQIAGKGGAKALFGTIGKLFTKTLKPLLKRIPGIGSLISWGFAVSRFKSGQLVRGLIDVASGLATLFPGIGTGIGIGLDVLNAFLDVKAGGNDEVKPAKSGFKIGDFFSKIKDAIMNNFPIKNLMQFYGGVGKVITGNFGEGFTDMAYAIPFMKPLSEFIFGSANEAKDDETGKFNFGKFFGVIKNKIFGAVLGMIPKKFLGIGIRKHVANFLGVNLSDVGLSVEEDDLSNNNEEVSVPKPKENKGSFGFGKKKQENVATEMQEKIKLDNTGSKIDAVKSEAENLFGLDSKTYLGGVNASMKPNIEIANAMNVNNQLLKEILQKINTGGGTVVNNNNSTSLVGSDKSIKNYREMYA